MAAHQAPPSLGFSRQEHWSGLPFPSPMHESEKWKWSRSVESDALRPHGLQPTRLLRPWDFPGKSTGGGCHHLLRKEETGIWNSQGRRKDKCLFSSTFLNLSHIKLLFSLSPKWMITQQITQFKLCARDYVTTMYPAWGQFLLVGNLLTNPVNLECILWEWVW